MSKDNCDTLTMRDFEEFVVAFSKLDPKFKRGLEMIFSGKDSLEAIGAIHSDDELRKLGGNGEFLDERVDDMSSLTKGNILLSLVEETFDKSSPTSNSTENKEDLISVPEINSTSVEDGVISSDKNVIS